MNFFPHLSILYILIELFDCMAAFRVQRSLSLFTKSTIRRLVAKSESAAPTSIFDFSVQNIAGTLAQIDLRIQLQ